MRPNGSDEKMLTSGWQDEAPSWAPDSEWLVFQSTQQGTGTASLHTISVAGGEARPLATPQPGADPNWSGAAQ